MALFKSKKKEAPVIESPAAAEVSSEHSEPVYAKGSAGDVKTFSVDPQRAAMIMAIVADQSDIPLNQLKFISIKEVTE